MHRTRFDGQVPKWLFPAEMAVLVLLWIVLSALGCKAQNTPSFAIPHTPITVGFDKTITLAIPLTYHPHLKLNFNRVHRVRTKKVGR